MNGNPTGYPTIYPLYILLIKLEKYQISIKYTDFQRHIFNFVHGGGGVQKILNTDNFITVVYFTVFKSKNRLVVRQTIKGICSAARAGEGRAFPIFW